MATLALVLICATLMLLCMYCMRLREDLHEEKRKRVAAETEIAQRDIAARAAKEVQDRIDAEIDECMRKGLQAIEAELNAALRKKPKADVLRFPTIVSRGRVARFDSPPESA